MRAPIRPGLARDLASLWFQAPMVIAMRSQAMGIAMMTGNTKNMAEFNRMVTEKAAAAVESAMAVNAAVAGQAMTAAAAIATGRKPKSSAKAAEKIAHAAVKPYSKRVRSNTRRLSKKKV
ncbi:hypothetical protein [Rhizobium sp. BK251]|uniref:hypothetical protein n=1 Tax=Rhizobium sp. BK251 TaxID=2512125 RepID=UPI00104B4C22|nr:hypothetical protein [Rhizobium sp. BK251]TCL73861.1 hypothetical protein EV286_103395 [Rhizobium sp. BK251]